LCPLKNVGSETPAHEMNRYVLFKALAIVLAIEVFPVPGGPLRSKINPLDFYPTFLSLLTAIISIILSLTFSNPSISLFKTFSA